MSATQTSTTTATGNTPTQSSSSNISTTTLPAARKVKGTIAYLNASIEKPYLYLCKPPKGEPTTNVIHDMIEKDVIDLHGTTYSERLQNGFHTKAAGFQILDRNSWGLPSTEVGWKSNQWESKDWIEKQYYQDIDALLKRQLGVTSTTIFDHTFRKSQTSHLPDDPENRKPVAQAHADQSRWAGENRIEKHLGREVLEKVKKGELHAQLVNVWRPMRTVEELPLAVADSRTIYRGEQGGPSDWVESELKYETWSGQTLLIHHRPEHQWYYYKGLEPDQAILLKCYDSETETRTPHTAFVDPSTPADAKPRWSIEVRVLCLTEKNHN